MVKSKSKSKKNTKPKEWSIKERWKHCMERNMDWNGYTKKSAHDICSGKAARIPNLKLNKRHNCECP